MKNLTLKNLALACNGTYVGPKEMEDRGSDLYFHRQSKSRGRRLICSY